MKSFTISLLIVVLLVHYGYCYRSFLSTRLDQIRFLKPLNVGSLMTSWSYKTLPEDFIVIEDRVLESYGQNFSTQAIGNVDPNTPDVAQLELAKVLGEEQLNKLIVLSLAPQSSWSGLESITLKIFPEYYDDNRRGGKKKVVVQRWDKSRPDYLHFTVVKSMLSTSEMVDKLAKMTSMLPTRFEFCGSKDKRALTFQRVSSWRVDQDVIARVSTESMLVRDVCVAQAPLHLGDLSGNFFAITLRKQLGTNTQNSLSISDQLSASDVLSSFSAVAAYPFMNVFGAQRFGSPLPSNPEVGMRLLASDYRGAVLMLLLAPSTQSELDIGGLDLTRLNAWLDKAHEIEKKTIDYDAARKPGEPPGYFRYLSEKFEEYKAVLEQAILDGKFNEIDAKIGEDEKMGDEWQAMLNSEEKNENEKRGPEEYSDNVLELKEVDDLTLEDDASSLDELYSTTISSSISSSISSTSSSSSTVSTVILKKKAVTSQKQLNAIRDLRERLDSLSDLLKGRPFDTPKSTSFLQKKILSQLYEEMSRKCEGDLLKVNFSRVFSVLPQALRQLFVNSYQSLLWNEVAIDRCNSNKHNTDIPVKKTNKADHGNTETVGKAYMTNSVVELKAMLKLQGLKVSGKKEELVARLVAADQSNASMKVSVGRDNESDERSGVSVNSDSNIVTSPTGFQASDTAVVGDVVLVDVNKTPLTAWHVAAQNISLNGNHIHVWSKDVNVPKDPVPEIPLVINSNTPFNMNPNSPFYQAKMSLNSSDRGGDRDRDNGRGGRGGRGDRGRRGSERGSESEMEGEKDEIREVKACYHVVTSEDERLRLFPIESVIVALPGASTFSPPGGSMVKRLAEDRMEVLLTGMHHDKIFRLAGAYRHLVTIAKNVRFAPVYTTAHTQQSFEYDSSTEGSVDEDIVYDEWSYSRAKEPKTTPNKVQDLKHESDAAVAEFEPPVWVKKTESASEKSLVPEYPFSTQVEKMWECDVIPKLLYDVYSSSSSSTSSGASRNIGVLPPALTRTIEACASSSSDVDSIVAHTPEKDVEKEREVEGLRISFALCASTYATTFLDHLVETINKKQT